MFRQGRTSSLTEALNSRAIGAYLGLAIGDALGASVEFMTPREIVAKYGVHQQIIGGGWLRLRAGQVTDDTGMSLALGEAILAHKQVSPAIAAEAFSTWMRSKPVDIGHTVRRGIMRFRQQGATTAPYDEHGAGNGACMRCLPVALSTLGRSPVETQEAVLAQAHVTHNNQLSDSGTLFVVELVQAALQGASLAGLETLTERFVSQNPCFAFRDRAKVENPSAFIVDTLRSVLQALFGQREFEAAMIDVVNRGGDADTSGAILGMIAGALWGETAIPKRWLRRLERLVRAKCEQQAVDLLRLAPGYRLNAASERQGFWRSASCK